MKISQNMIRLLLLFCLMVIGMLNMPTVNAEECKCHNVGVYASVTPEQLFLGRDTIPEKITFNVTIYNSEYCDEDTISLKIIEQRTGKVLYYDPARLVYLAAHDRVSFVIEIPVNQLSGFDVTKGWEQETYKVSAYQRNYYLDWIPWNNYAYTSIRLKPYDLDVSISGSGQPSPITSGDRLYIITNTNANTKKPISGTLSVMVSGPFVYHKLTKDIEIYHGVSSDVFEFDTTGWEPGAYNVIMSFPVQPWELSKENNLYEFDVWVSVP